MNNYINTALTQTPLAARTHVQNASSGSSNSGSNTSSSNASAKGGGAVMDFASRASGFETRALNHTEKLTEAAAAEHQVVHKTNDEKNKIPVFKKQEELPFVDDYPERRPKQSVHTAKRDERRVRDRREPTYDTIDFSKGLMEILEKSQNQPTASGRPQIYNQFSHTTNMNWGSGRFLDFFT